jgi:hypothetical protein
MGRGQCTVLFVRPPMGCKQLCVTVRGDWECPTHVLVMKCQRGATSTYPSLVLSTGTWLNKSALQPQSYRNNFRYRQLEGAG